MSNTPNRLDVWLTKNGIPSARLAEAANVYPASVGGWRNGEHLPTWEKAKKIEKFTRGEITTEMLREDYLLRRGRKRDRRRSTRTARPRARRRAR